MAKANKH